MGVSSLGYYFITFQHAESVPNFYFADYLLFVIFATCGVVYIFYNPVHFLYMLILI